MGWLGDRNRDATPPSLHELFSFLCVFLMLGGTRPLLREKEVTSCNQRTALYCAQLYIVLCSTVLRYTLLHYTLLYCTLLTPLS